MRIKRHWFNQIASGQKNIEYREHSPYWRSRIDGHHHTRLQFFSFDHHNRPISCLCEIESIDRSSMDDEGVEADFYAIHLGPVIHVNRPVDTAESTLQLGL